jgi:glycosyltransferase involved in cell wall biosynthesis
LHNSKKILIVWFRHYPWDVRIEKIALSLKNAGYEVEILCRWRGEDKEFESINDLNIYRMGFGKNSLFTAPFFNNIFWKKAISERIETLSPTLIIVRDMYLGEMTAKIAKKNNIPVLMDMAEHYPGAMREWQKYNNNTIKRFLMHKYKLPDKIEKNSVKNLNGIITVCDEQSDRMKEQYGFSKKNLEVVHNIPMNPLKNAKKGIVNESLVLFHHGYMTSEKSLKVFIKGFLKTAAKTNLKLILAGDGENLEEYKKIVDESKLPDRVIFTGSYQFNELESLLSEIDIGIIPYQINQFNNYTIHNKIFDFFAAGKPVITSQAKPLKRIIEETDAGIAINCESEDDVSQFLKNIYSYNWNKFADKAFLNYEKKYNWYNEEKKLLKFIKNYI